MEWLKYGCPIHMFYHDSSPLGDGREFISWKFFTYVKNIYIMTSYPKWVLNDNISQLQLVFQSHEGKTYQQAKWISGKKGDDLESMMLKVLWMEDFANDW